MEQNPVGLTGLEFIEFCGPEPVALENMFKKLGFAKVARHKSKKIDLWRQNKINFLLNSEPGTFAESFAKSHGPAVCSTGFRVKDKDKGFKAAVERGARPFEGSSVQKGAFELPVIYGIGDSLVYFLDDENGKVFERDFEFLTEDRWPTGLGLEYIDHLTNNVPFGEMQKWCSFYENVFNFKERRFFDIKGAKTGLVSKVMRSPCSTFSIPINEPDREGSKSQIQEYLDDYKGSGIQHIALLSRDILASVSGLSKQGVQFLDAPDAYFDMIPDRVPHVTEDLTSLKNHRVLVDGDQEGYLLQIFTQNMCGPIFFEVIQRKGHEGFGEGNFQALFEAIERDQQRRGVL